MDPSDAEIAVGLIADYWPRSLDAEQTRAWARVIARSQVAFDDLCRAIADMAATRTRPPSLAEIIAAIRPAPVPVPLEQLVDPADVPTEPGEPAPADRGRLWAAHVAALGRVAGERRTLHDHHRGVAACPVCSHPGVWRSCGDPACFCGS